MLVNTKLSGANAVRLFKLELFNPTSAALGTMVLSAIPELPAPNWIEVHF